MNNQDRILLTTGSIAALLGVTAGVAEVVAGTVSWAGSKNDPTTLGWVTIGLGLVIGGVSVPAARSHRPGAQLAAAAALLVCGLVGLTTAGLAWSPAGIATIVTFALVVRRLRGTDAWRAAIRARWAPALVGVLALIYLTFGIVARDAIGLLGIAGAGLACVALAVSRRSHMAAALGIVLAAVPFAVATAWTVVTPVTAVLMLAIGLPHVLDSSNRIAAEEASP
jgi:hypothetical protein